MPKKSKNNKKRLVVIAGPSCSGKSWLIEQIRSENPSKFARLVKKKCKLKGRVSKNQLHLRRLRKDWKKHKEGKIKKRLGRGGFLHFDITGGQQKLKRKILGQLIKNADQVVVLNIVVNFDKWIEFNELRMAHEPEHGSSSFVRRILKLRAKDPSAARNCYSYTFDRWQQYLEVSPLFKCMTMESRQTNFIDQIERDRLGLVKLKRFQLAWMKIRFDSLLSKIP